MLGQVVVTAVGDALELVPTPREEELHVGGGRRVVRQLVGVVGPEPELLGGHAVVEVPLVALVAPVLVPLLSASSGGTKNSISICSNSRVRNTKWPGVISLRNDLPTCAMPNGGLLADVLQHVGEVRRTCPARSRAGGTTSAPCVGDRAGVGLEHQVEVAGLGERSHRAAVRAHVRDRRACRGANALWQFLQSTSGSVKFVEVAGRLPDRRAAPRMAASRPTTSSRSCTIERHQASFTLRSSRTPMGP